MTLKWSWKQHEVGAFPEGSPHLFLLREGRDSIPDLLEALKCRITFEMHAVLGSGEEGLIDWKTGFDGDDNCLVEIIISVFSSNSQSCVFVYTLSPEFVMYFLTLARGWRKRKMFLYISNALFFPSRFFLIPLNCERVGSLYDYNVLYPRKWSFYIFSHPLLLEGTYVTKSCCISGLWTLGPDPGSDFLCTADESIGTKVFWDSSCFFSEVP